MGCGIRRSSAITCSPHGYVREEDHVLDEELPLWVPVPALAEMQVALDGKPSAEVTRLTGFELKRG